MKCAYCGEKITRPSNMAFSVEAYELSWPEKLNGLMFDSIACATAYAEERGYSPNEYHYISKSLKDLTRG